MMSRNRAGFDYKVLANKNFFVCRYICASFFFLIFCCQPLDALMAQSSKSLDSYGVPKKYFDDDYMDQFFGIFQCGQPELEIEVADRVKLAGFEEPIKIVIELVGLKSVEGHYSFPVFDMIMTSKLDIVEISKEENRKKSLTVAFVKNEFYKKMINSLKKKRSQFQESIFFSHMEGCAGLMKLSGGRIENSFLALQVENGADSRKCVHKALLNSLGFFPKCLPSERSVFNLEEGLDEFGELDWFLMRQYYRRVDSLGE